MHIDVENPAVKLCLKGMEAEMKGMRDKALTLYMEAWDGKADGFEGCIAAHYIAKLQDSPEKIYYWNNLALQDALKIDDMRTQEFYPSLYLNLGKSCEDLGRMEDAKRYYGLAADVVDLLPDEGLGNMIRQGIERGMKRVGG